MSQIKFKELCAGVAVMLGLMQGAGAAHGSTDVSLEVLSQYVQIQSALAEDSHQGVKEAAETIVRLSRGKKDAALARIGAAAEKLAAAKGVSGYRKALKGLSKPTVQWVEKNKPEGFAIAYCPMAGAKWVQKTGAIRNPYYGKEMLECGEFQNN